MTSILALTNSYDDSHIEAVQSHIDHDVHTFTRVDVDRIVRGEHQILWDYQSMRVLLVTEKETIRLDEVDSVWFRKPFGFGSNYGFVESIKDPVQRTVIEKEMRDLVDSLCAILADKFWLNHPQALSRARLKPYQLHLAREVGLPLPDTVITNDPDAGRKFCDEGPTVFKPLTVPQLEYGDTRYSVETTLMTDELINSLHLIKSQPVILQRYIEKSSELRVTCVGDQLFVARQMLNGDKSTNKVVDWRILQGTKDSTYDMFELPTGITDKVSKLMRKLDLGFATMDFAVDKAGECFFLEVNPNGQWLGYTDEIGLPAAASIARCLVHKTRHL